MELRLKRLSEYCLLSLAALLLTASCGAFRTVPEARVRHLEQCPKIDVGDSVVRVCDEGKGDAIVLLHGLSGSVEVWGGWARAMKDTHRVIRLDLPGYGLSTPYKDRKYSLARDAQVVTKVLDRLGVGAFSIAGNSSGGHLAWSLAHKNPRVKKLILISPIGLSPKPARVNRTPRWVRWFARHVTIRCLNEHEHRRAYGSRSRVERATAERYYDLARLPGARDAFVDRLNAGVFDETLIARLQEITIPTLILWGAEDRWLDPDDACRFRNRMPNARLLVVAGRGHVMMEEAPEETARVAMQFLRDPAHLTFPSDWRTDCFELKQSSRIPPFGKHGISMPDTNQLPPELGRFEGMRVFRIGTSGPPILLLHELPGLTPETFKLAERIAARGYTVYMPLLFGEPGHHATNLVPVLFGASWFPQGFDRMPRITGKLRRLAAYLQESHCGQKMGVMGMCLTGNLPAAFLDLPFVHAAVMSQPSLPLLRPAKLALSEDQIQAMKAPVLYVRFSHDRVSPWEKRRAFQKMAAKYGKQVEFHTVDSSPWNRDCIPPHAHAVYTDGMFDSEGRPVNAPGLNQAWDVLISYLDCRLK